MLFLGLFTTIKYLWKFIFTDKTSFEVLHEILTNKTSFLSTERRHKRQVDERRERMVLRQQQREEDYRRKKAEHYIDPKVAVRVSSFVVYFDPQKGALHAVWWSKSLVSAWKQVFKSFLAETKNFD